MLLQFKDFEFPYAIFKLILIKFVNNLRHVGDFHWTPVSSTKKIDRHDITETLFKVEHDNLDPYTWWPLTFLCWYRHFNKKWRIQTSFMGSNTWRCRKQFYNENYIVFQLICNKIDAIVLERNILFVNGNKPNLHNWKSRCICIVEKHGFTYHLVCN